MYEGLKCSVFRLDRKRDVETNAIVKKAKISVLYISETLDIFPASNMLNYLNFELLIEQLSHYQT